MAVFTDYVGSGDTTLTDALLAPSSGIVVNAASIVLKASGPGTVEFYDGSLSALGISSGLLLTSGTTPGTSNTVPWFGQDNSGVTGFNNGDANIDAVVNTVFQTQSYDATTFSFDFTVTDPAATSVSFDLVFGSDEFPEWVDQFVDSAIVMVNGVNYALFNHDPLHPLSVISGNLAAGYFQDNAGNVLPIEYDGVSHVLKIVAPIIPGATNHIEIGIADTGDHIYDSGIFLANLSAGNIPGSGVVSTSPTTGTTGDDNLMGTSQAEYFDLNSGNDIAYAGAGDDIVVGGSGNDSEYGGSGADQVKGDAGNDSLDGGADVDTAVFTGASGNYTITPVGGGFTITDNGPTSEGIDTLTNVENAKFSDGLFSIGSDGSLTLLTDPGTPPANTPGSVIVSGVGSVGNTLTAAVNDPDGIPSSGPGVPTYQWLADGIDIGGAQSSTYTVLAGDVGKNIQVVVSYTDNGSNLESPVSAAKTILNADSGDLIVTLMQLTAPSGASTIDPLTTLIKDAIDLGISPNVAALGIKAVLGLPDEVNLLTYDAYAALQTDPNDPIALLVEKVAVQTAILTSLSDDDTGVNLTLAIINAGAANQTLDLADVNDLSAILGIPAILDPNTGKYPEPLNEILDRNKSMSDAIADGGDVSVIETEWQDFCSIQDNVASTSIADLNIHVNQAPTGSATASLPDGLEGTDYLVNASDLLQGFSDSDGGTLSVSGLVADNGVVTDNGDGTFTITPGPGFNGPVEVVYDVLDGQGGSASGSQLFVIAASAPTNNPPTGSATAILGAGSEDIAYIVSASDLLTGFSDIDGDTLSVSGLSADNGVVTDNGDGTFTITPTANFNGTVNVSYDVTDGVASIAANQSYTLAAVNDAPTGTATATLAAGTEDIAYIVSASDLLIGFSDIDGDTLSMSGLNADNGVVTDNGDGTFTITPTANFNGTVNLSYDVTDGIASIAANQSYNLAAVNDAPTGTATAILAAGTEDIAYTVSASDLLTGFSDVDGDTLSVSGLSASDGSVTDNGDGTFTITPTANFNGTVNLSYDVTDGIASIAANQSYTLAAAPETLTGTAGADILNGGIDDNLIFGLAGNDSLAGGGGNDTLDGGDGKDTLDGGAGVDSASYETATSGVNVSLATTKAQNTGGSGRDMLINIENISGSAFADKLTGNAGVNVLTGGAGNDSLTGGGDADSLWGGTGADRFIYTVLSDSTPGLQDTIYDFSHSESDRIDLSAIDAIVGGKGGKNDAFTWGGADTPTANGVWYSESAGHTEVHADVNGDAIADLQITLVGTGLGLTATDFIL